MLANNLPMQNATARLEAVKPSERIAALDLLRGFALFGVLLAYALWNLGNPPDEAYSQTDRILNWLLAVLVDTKFYTLFATLFGLGFSIQFTRASRPRYQHCPGLLPEAVCAAIDRAVARSVAAQWRHTRSIRRDGAVPSPLS